MGRLFWKFFLSILLAQIAATVGVGTVFWLRDQSRAQAWQRMAGTPAIDTSRSAEFLIDSAAATLKHGGKEALRALVADSTRYSLYVIDQDGHEMLSRTVTPELKAHAARLLAQGGPRSVVRMLSAPDGERYLVFLRWVGQRGPGPGPVDPRLQPSPFGAATAPMARGPDLPDGHPGAGGPGGRSGPGMRDMPGGPSGSGHPAGHGPPGAMGGPPDRGFIPWVTIVIATAASLLFAGLMAWYFSRPIRALRRAFESAAAGDLAPRFDGRKHAISDELTDLGRDFDSMSARLHALMDGQRRLLHDVSHELRSPLARLQAAIGLAHQQPDKIAASLERIERESVRMDKLVGELLTLSRLEAGPALPAKEDIAVMDLIEEVAGDASFEAQQCQRCVAVRGQALAQVMVRGAPDLLWRALENVVRNAIKHSPSGGTITIDVAATRDRVSIQVSDNGPGVRADDLSAIFEPFFRSNAASNNVDGHGLGLAIAQRVMSAHGGTISAANRPEGGLCVTMTLPVALA